MIKRLLFSISIIFLIFGIAYALNMKIVVLECDGNCSGFGSPNKICNDYVGSGWKALTVDCETIEIKNVHGTKTKSMDETLDWCTNAGEQDLTVTCYQ